MAAIVETQRLVKFYNFNNVEYNNKREAAAAALSAMLSPHFRPSARVVDMPGLAKALQEPAINSAMAELLTFLRP